MAGSSTQVARRATDYPEPQLFPEVRPRRRLPGLPEPVIVAAARTPIGRLLGSLARIPAPRLGAVAVGEVLRRAGVDPGLVDLVILGNVLGAGLGQNPARQAALGAGLPSTVSAFAVDKVCASGLQAVALAAQAIRCGDAEVVVAGGMESMSNAPFLLRGVRDGYRLGHGQLVDSMISDGLWDCTYDFPMGSTGELVAQRYGIGREQQDAYALESHRKALQAAGQGRFREEIVPVEVTDGKGKPLLFDRDEGPRADTDREKLGRLRPAFDPAGTVTAGNAPGVNDGAAALLVMSEQRADALGLQPLARILDHYCAGLDPAWVMLTPIPSVRGLLARNPGWHLDDFDVVELNEAFSVQALAVMGELELPAERVNPNGGAVALGHPIGASGARILVTLVHELHRRGGGKGLATLCLGGGNGLALAVEASQG